MCPLGKKPVSNHWKWIGVFDNIFCLLYEYGYRFFSPHHSPMPTPSSHTGRALGPLSQQTSALTTSLPSTAVTNHHRIWHYRYIHSLKTSQSPGNRQCPHAETSPSMHRNHRTEPYDSRREANHLIGDYIQYSIPDSKTVTAKLADIFLSASTASGWQLSRRSSGNVASAICMISLRARPLLAAFTEEENCR